MFPENPYGRNLQSGYQNHQTPQFPPQPPQAPHEKPKLWKIILSWLSVILGGLILISSTFGLEVGGFLMGFGILLPGAWFLLHERREKNGAKPMQRHWIIITIVSLVALFGGTALVPVAEKKPTSTPSPSSTTSQTPSTSSTTASSPKTSPKPSPTSETQPILTTENKPPAEKKPEAPKKEETPAGNQPQGFVAPPRKVPPAPAPAGNQPQDFVAPPREVPPAPAPAVGGKVVHPGSFCNGGTGVTKKGTPMICAPGSDGKNRWQSA